MRMLKRFSNAELSDTSYFGIMFNNIDKQIDNKLWGDSEFDFNHAFWLSNFFTPIANWGPFLNFNSSHTSRILLPDLHVRKNGS